MKGVHNVLTKHKFDRPEQEDIIGSYFQPTTKRANELLHQSSRLDTNTVINAWRDFAKRNRSSENSSRDGSPPKENFPGLNSNSSSTSRSYLSNSWMNGLPPSHNDLFIKKPLRLEALPNIIKNRRDRITTMEFL